MPKASNRGARADRRVADIAPQAREVQNAQAALDGGGSHASGGGLQPGSPSVPAATPMADERAERAVTMAADGRTLLLTTPGAPPVPLGPYQNPAVAKERLSAIRLFAAALLLSPRPGTPPLGPPRAKRRSARRLADGGYPVDQDLHQMTDDGGPPAPDPARWTDPAWCDAPDGQQPSQFCGPPPRPSAPPPPAGVGGPSSGQE